MNTHTYNNFYKTGYISKQAITSVRESQNLTSQTVSHCCVNKDGKYLKRRDFYPINGVAINKDRKPKDYTKCSESDLFL